MLREQSEKTKSERQKKRVVRRTDQREWETIAKHQLSHRQRSFGLLNGPGPRSTSCFPQYGFSYSHPSPSRMTGASCSLSARLSSTEFLSDVRKMLAQGHIRPKTVASHRAVACNPLPQVASCKVEVHNQASSSAPGLPTPTTAILADHVT